MGCVQSSEKKDKGSSSAPGAAVISAGGGEVGGASGVVSDPRLPLNARQKYSMLASWKGIARALEPTGIYMFIKLFEEHQDLLALFSKFHQLKTRDEQASSAELAEHATNVMNTLDESIRTMDNMDSFLLYLHQIGQSHCKIPGFQKEYFRKIKGPFLESVKMTLGDRYTDNIENIYQVSINLIIETLIEGYEKGNNKSSSSSGAAAGPS